MDATAAAVGIVDEESAAGIGGDALLATLNFSRDRTDGGIWSNLDPSRASVRTGGRQVQIRDASLLAEAPRLEREGFALIDRPFARPRWNDAGWIDDVYVPDCMTMIQGLTGADHVGLVHPGVLRRRADPARNDATYVPPARFVHFDQSANSIAPMLARAAGDDWRDRFRAVRGYNIWRCVSPPPQNTPLALCDQRTFDRADMVIGHLVEPGLDHPIEYVTAMHNPAQRWWHFPLTEATQAIVFKGFDLDAAQPMGCLHSAFDHPLPSPAAPVRESIENRVLAFFA